MTPPEADPEGRELSGPFLVDAMCGKLAVYLRMCGHDAAYALDRGVEADDALRSLARDEGRTIVTRDSQLGAAAHGVLLTERDVEGQLRELREAGLELSLPETPRRCGSCNGRLDRVDPADSTPAYAPAPGARNVWRCRDCGHHFWRGSHWERVGETLDRG